jgi:hypothetical protein
LGAGASLRPLSRSALAAYSLRLWASRGRSLSPYTPSPSIRRAVRCVPAPVPRGVKKGIALTGARALFRPLRALFLILGARVLPPFRFGASRRRRGFSRGSVRLCGARPCAPSCGRAYARRALRRFASLASLESFAPCAGRRGAFHPLDPRHSPCGRGAIKYRPSRGVV